LSNGRAFCDGGGGAFILVASGGVTFSGTGYLGDGQGAVYGTFTNTGTFPDGLPATLSYSAWKALLPTDYFLNGGGGGGGGMGQLLYPPTVTGVTPNSGPTSGGIPVTITGTHFVDVASVIFVGAGIAG
jgi:hypothetical protein